MDGSRISRKPCSLRRRPSAAFSPTTTRPAEFLYDNLVDRNQPDRGLAPRGRREAAVSRLVLHLSAACAAADERGRAADRAAGADQSMVRGRQDRRHHAVPRLSAAIWQSNFISAMPTNLYGPGDNFDLQSSHVVPALIAKAHAVKTNSAERARGLGLGLAAARIPVCRRSGRRAGLPDAALLRRRAHQCRRRRGRHDQASSRSGSCARRRR